MFMSVLKERSGTTVAKEDVPELILKVAREAKDKYGRECVSAVSKMLWMAHGHPIAIYDNQARTGLEKSTKLQIGALAEYKAYYEHWQEEYHRAEKSIHDAQAWLPNSHIFKRLQRYGVETEDKLRCRVEQPWFANRIFDHFLMNIGWIGTRNSVVEVAKLLDPDEALLGG